MIWMSGSCEEAVHLQRVRRWMPGNDTDSRQTAKRKNATWAALDTAVQQPGSHERRTDGQEDDEKVALPDKATMPGMPLHVGAGAYLR